MARTWRGVRESQVVSHLWQRRATLKMDCAWVHIEDLDIESGVCSGSYKKSIEYQTAEGCHSLGTGNHLIRLGALTRTHDHKKTPIPSSRIGRIMQLCVTLSAIP
jgi:hypothetical protein